MDWLIERQGKIEQRLAKRHLKAGYLVLTGNIFDSAVIKVSVIDAEFRKRFGNPYAVIHRADIHLSIYEEVQTDANIRVHTNARVEHVEGLRRFEIRVFQHGRHERPVLPPPPATGEHVERPEDQRQDDGKRRAVLPIQGPAWAPDGPPRTRSHRRHTSGAGRPSYRRRI